MPLNAAIVGVSTAPVVHTIDARWLMAYAAGLGEMLHEPVALPWS